MFRATTANTYLQQCEMTIVVADIKRATSDAGFRQHYLDAHSRRHHGSVILVATRADVSIRKHGLSCITDCFITGVERR